MTDLAGKVCLIAGASTGMGRRTAIHAGACGATVICAARRVDLCEAVAKEIQAAGGQATALPFDGVDPASVVKLLADVEASYGRLDGLFNNLGDTLGASTIDETPLERWENTLAVNLSSVFYLLRAAIPLMRASGGGSIVNNSSTAGVQGIATMADYSAAKWGLIGLSRSAALELGPDNIRVNVIAPGIIQTEKMEVFREQSPAMFDKLLADVPIGKFGDMQHVAELVTWLLSDASGYVNGVTLPIDGGRTA
ncbi:MAG: SDR family NAD(P)-dependent oxidoreductase [Pseudomonadota bacterium]